MRSNSYLPSCQNLTAPPAAESFWARFSRLLAVSPYGTLCARSVQVRPGVRQRVPLRHRRPVSLRRRCHFWSVEGVVLRISKRIPKFALLQRGGRRLANRTSIRGERVDQSAGVPGSLLASCDLRLKDHVGTLVFEKARGRNDALRGSGVVVKVALATGFVIAVLASIAGAWAFQI